MNKMKENNSHEDHNHGKAPIVFYFIGLGLTLIALGLLLSDKYLLLQNSLFSMATLTAGYHVILVEGLSETIENFKKKKKFIPNSHILMGLAALGASLIGSFWEGSLLILIFSGAHFLEEFAEGKSKREITKLVEMNPTTARLILKDGTTKSVGVEEIQIGDQLQVLNGDQIPIDGIILSGSTSINGESIPKEKTKGDSVFGSTINGTGAYTMEVTKENKDTVFSKILELVNLNQDNQTKAASILEKFEPRYVIVVLIVIPLVMVFAPFFVEWTWQESIYRGLVLLVAASPCALAASTVSVTLSATSNLAKKGVLSKGSAYLSQMAAIDTIAFDKTGTLTRGKPEVTDYSFVDKVNEDDIIDIIVALEKESNHPLANAILEKFESKETLDIHVINQISKDLTGDYEGNNYRIGKPTSFKNILENHKKLNDQWASEGKNSGLYC